MTNLCYNTLKNFVCHIEWHEEDFMKKIIAALLCATMVFSLTACGNKGTGEAASEPVAEATEAEKTEEVATEAAAEVKEGAEYKVGIVQYVDDASLNQIEKSIEAELDAKAAELGVTFNYSDYVFNGQADSTVLNQIATQLVADNVDIIIPIATPTACIMQNATADNQIPVVFSAVSDPVGAGLVADMAAPGGNITGTSDAVDAKIILDLAIASVENLEKFGLLYDKGQDASTKAIADAKAYLDEKGIAYVEKTGTTNEEISLAADALIAEGVQAVFTPCDNTVMTAELAIFEKFNDAKVAHFTAADSFALNGAFCGYGVDYTELGKATADIAVDILTNGKNPAEIAVSVMDTGIATVNTETAEAISVDYSMFNDMCTQVVETKTAENFE